MYTKKNQRRVVTALLDGVTKIDGETIIETNSKAKDYFAKGHLAPDANFVYEVLQDATYYFINVAPQVRSFWIKKSPQFSVSIIQWRKLESPWVRCEKSCHQVSYIFSLKKLHYWFVLVQVEKRPPSNHGHIWHSGVPWRPPTINLNFSLKFKLCASTKTILEGCPWSRNRTVSSLHGFERPPCNSCSKKSLQKQVCVRKRSSSKHGFVQVHWDELLAAPWIWGLGFWIRLLLLCAWCAQNNKSEFHKKKTNLPKKIMLFLSSQCRQCLKTADCWLESQLNLLNRPRRWSFRCSYFISFFSQATQLFLDTFGPLLCCLLCCKNNLYWLS